MTTQKIITPFEKIATTGNGLSADLQKIIGQVEKLTDIGIALSSEKDTAQLLEKILLGAKSITNSDGGTLYRVDGNTIKIEIIRSDSLGISLGGEGNTINIPNIPLYEENGEPNLKNVVCYSYHNNKTINIDDAYDAVHFDFAGTKAFDKKNNYRSKSFLSIPLTNHQGEIIGILQLINATDPETQEIIKFDSVSQRFAEALASQAATVLTKQQLITDLENMFESLVKLIATAVDEKSPYTGGHCRRVPELTLMLTEAAHNTDHGYLQDFRLTEADRYELTIASWLHDCGKIITPEYIIDKATKLETIFDRIHLLETRFEVLKRDREIAFLKQQLAELQSNTTSSSALEHTYQADIARLDDDLAFIRLCNTGGEAMSGEDISRLQSLQKLTWSLNNVDVPLLTDEEVYNLSIFRGTLTSEERNVINNHINVTISMLEAIKFPKHLQNVVEYAGGHHERMDGKGYPKGLSREEMSIPARAMAIADVFEALTAKDRPYKKGKKLSEALSILKKLKEDKHIDPDLYDAFIKQKIYKKYAEKFLDDVQIDID
ncbi:HD-GYP domain-containing protein (c-di-GMP phosphodiesterase class II) [Methylobacter tundripaludum]|uniref:HD-GYP domain-containing protein (C-di-GMP phosphodiesterase class II) n=1 Tax=Methylobacter tundripaludum TaxID=173365 RepID=A0A2S6HG80_9GAMM|nr:HD domain-containing phosphohydrolase [Methylobacter tundripaludum]PPK76487.1 HD-GYP domain-containing protein (c-di-GMP phosphodiesterase class II) [Methylobacter tundripaludum]